MGLPTQSIYIVGNEACERFSFYGMRSILTTYMVTQLAMMEKDALTVVHIFLALIYFTPLAGAWLADRFLGRYNCILYISLFYCLGHATLALGDLSSDVDVRKAVLFVGLGIIALGSGGIKPCVSAFVGDQMQGRSASDITRMYSAFYWSINLGSFFSFLVIPYLKDAYGYPVAFGVPGIFMGLATLIFWLGRRKYLHREPVQPLFFSSLFCQLFKGKDAAIERFGVSQMVETNKTVIGIIRFLIVAPLLVAVGVACYMGGGSLAQDVFEMPQNVALFSTIALLLYIIIISVVALKWAQVKRLAGFLGVVGHMIYKKQDVTTLYDNTQQRNARNLLRIIVAFVLIMPFWALFDQTASSWILQARDMEPFTIFGHKIGPDEMQSFNPLFVMTLIPLLTLYIYPYIGKYGTPIRRMGIGICLAGLSFLAVAWLQMRMDAGEHLSLLWQILPYFILTVSEILVSTTGLEYAYTAAGKNLKSTVTSFWYLSITTANLFVVLLTSLMSDPASTFTFTFYSILALVIGCLFIYVTTRKRMQPEAEEETA